VSRERARRRAEQEQAKVEAAAERARREERAQRRDTAVGPLRTLLGRRSGAGAAQGSVARRRRGQNAVIAVLFLIVQVVTWLLSSDWWVRFGVLAVSVLALPVLVTLTLDRRS